MIDINIYRSQIGLFSPRIKKKSVFKSHYFIPLWWNSNNSGKKTLSLLQSLCKLVMIIVLVYPSTAGSSHPQVSGQPPIHGVQGQAVRHADPGSSNHCCGGSHGVQVVDVPGNDCDGTIDPKHVFCIQANHYVRTRRHGILCWRPYSQDESGGEHVVHGQDLVDGAAAG